MEREHSDRVWYLSRSEFADAIAKGLGRAFLHVRDCGLDNIKDLVLNACLHHLAYDPQCEGSRAKWLFSMFDGSPHYPEFRAKILDALEIEDETWDLLQLCELSKEMGLAGDLLATQKLANLVYTHGSRKSIDDGMGADELVDLLGIEAAMKLAKIYGERLLLDPNDWVPDNLSFFTNMSVEKQQIFDLYAATDETIATYQRYLIDCQISTENNRIVTHTQSKKVTVENIIERARQKKNEATFFFMRFGRQALPSELETILSLLEREPDEDICLRLLWVFWRVPLPTIIDRVFNWTDSENELLRESAIRVIAQTSSDRVYQLGRSKLEKCQIAGADRNVLDLFIKNYRSGDAAIILSKLNETKLDNHDLHSIGSSIIDIDKQQANPELAILLNWIYDRTPCSICREKIVARLDLHARTSEEIKYEYQFDSIGFKRKYLN